MFIGTDNMIANLNLADLNIKEYQKTSDIYIEI